MYHATGYVSRLFFFFGNLLRRLNLSGLYHPAAYSPEVYHIPRLRAVLTFLTSFDKSVEMCVIKTLTLTLYPYPTPDRLEFSRNVDVMRS